MTEIKSILKVKQIDVTEQIKSILKVKQIDVTGQRF